MLTISWRLGRSSNSHSKISPKKKGGHQKLPSATEKTPWIFISEILKSINLEKYDTTRWFKQSDHFRPWRSLDLTFQRVTGSPSSEGSQRIARYININIHIYIYIHHKLYVIWSYISYHSLWLCLRMFSSNLAILSAWGGAWSLNGWNTKQYVICSVA